MNVESTVWAGFVQAHGRIVGYSTEDTGVPPFPVDVPCNDELVIECRTTGTQVWPIYEPTAEPRP
ncbi:hypothetical protein ABZ215_24970 [Amycolatopsis sp. NPDC006131]|uniref:hypothetical protein n=1 Tax=Amycolatopsis sp. NPDC006131 TaxID=3156731 RepID=UPI0033A48F45